MPFLWKQDGVKAKVTLLRSVPSMEDAYTKHIENIGKDYEGNTVVLCNLLN